MGGLPRPARSATRRSGAAHRAGGALGRSGAAAGRRRQHCARSPCTCGSASRFTRTGASRGKGARGLGISALFAGASGTGKTMAAEVLAERAARSTSTASTLTPGRSANTSARPRRICARVFDAAEDRRRHPAVRRSRRAVRQAQRSQGQPRPLRQHRGQLSAAAHGSLSRAGDPHHQHEEARSIRRFMRRLRFIVQFPVPGRARSASRSGAASFPRRPRSRASTSPSSRGSTSPAATSATSR